MIGTKVGILSSTSGASILDYDPHNIWDSENVSIVGSTTTFLDYNKVGTKYNLANPAAANQPTYNPSSANFNNLPSFTFDGVNDYVSNSVSDYRIGDHSGMIISAYRLVSSTNLHLLTSADSSNNDYLINQLVIAGNGRFRLGTENAGVFNTHLGTDNINNTNTNVYAFGSNGTIHKFFNSGVADSISSTTAAGEWFGDVSSRNNIAIGAQLRAAPSYANIEWAMTGYFPYVNDATTVEIINFLKTKYL